MWTIEDGQRHAGYLTAVQTSLCGLITIGYTPKKKCKTKTNLIKTYLDKLFIFFERSKSDKIITIEKLEEFNEILNELLIKIDSFDKLINFQKIMGKYPKKNQYEMGARIKQLKATKQVRKPPKFVIKRKPPKFVIKRKPPKFRSIKETKSEEEIENELFDYVIRDMIDKFNTFKGQIEINGEIFQDGKFKQNFQLAFSMIK
ncbi:hypothetical protein LOTGIDRAFT_172850 [Lottia gigantea]|uniref:Uncharacterized protein n=1 Tax=Lottia gigantea TaxID=225164 RepID=V4CG30_LOTGI|nr:hypothetical protein LOTGIDRAFT_172850 [Lottia gigantea]ESP01015.1 hypothetical protein LOTGIDRAFT_172850 [Lottia gigantea]